MSHTLLVSTQNDDNFLPPYHADAQDIQNVALCGSAFFYDEARIFRIMDEIKYKFGIFRLVRGKEDRVGKITDKWSQQNGIKNITERISWFKHGGVARAMRDEHILNKYSPILVVCFISLNKYPDLYKRSIKNYVNVIKFYFP
ncbi:SLOG family protein [Labrys sp. La1]|uniref:SLOG family protein n=1 Tax=Labrys sp. La1 TaxID=3404917 RepID=UPI003EBB34F3